MYTFSKIKNTQATQINTKLHTAAYAVRNEVGFFATQRNILSNRVA